MPSCDDCQFCAERPANPNNLGAPRELECRRNPPQLAMAMTQHGPFVISGFPTVTTSMLCAEFRVSQ